MNLAIKKCVLILRSARLILWLPILVNIEVLTLLLTNGAFKGIVLGLSLCCISSYGFLINDISDIRIDLKNQAGKLENASQEDLALARVFSSVFLSVGLFLSLILGIKAMLILSLVAGGLAAYTYWIRPKLVLANLLAAFLCSTPVWLPNLIFQHWPNTAQWVIITISVLIFMGREVVFDIQDSTGDKQALRRTLPIVFGKAIAVRLAVIWQLSACALLIIFCAISTFNLPLTRQVLLWSSLIPFGFLMIPANLGVLLNPERAGIVRDFTLRTRLAMFLLAPIMLALLIKL